MFKKNFIWIVSHMDVGPISDANKKTWQYLNGRLRVRGESAKLANIGQPKNRLGRHRPFKVCYLDSRQ